jgi:TRAP-type C4-dicarboxylate transport system permease small subunit
MASENHSETGGFKKAQALADVLNWMARKAALITMIILFPVISANIVSRYLFNYSLAWSSEVTRYSFVFMTFLATAVALKENTHAKFDFLLDRSSLRAKRFLLLFNQLVMAVLSLVLAVTGIMQVIHIWPTRAAYMQFLSMGWIYAVIPVAGLLMFFFTLLKIWGHLFGRERR